MQKHWNFIPVKIKIFKLYLTCYLYPLYPSTILLPILSRPTPFLQFTPPPYHCTSILLSPIYYMVPITFICVLRYPPHILMWSASCFVKQKKKWLMTRDCHFCLSLRQYYFFLSCSFFEKLTPKKNWKEFIQKIMW